MQDVSRHLGCVFCVCLAAGSALLSGMCEPTLADSAHELFIRQWLAAWRRACQQYDGCNSIMFCG
jgi:hypothetical protein